MLENVTYIPLERLTLHVCLVYHLLEETEEVGDHLMSEKLVGIDAAFDDVTERLVSLLLEVTSAPLNVLDDGSIPLGHRE